MRRKKQKHTKKAMSFYRINFGFRPPYKVIVDGNFIHALESMKRGDAKEVLAKLLGEQVRVFTTKCVMHELRTLGKEMADTRQACKRYALHKCGHDEAHASAGECLLAQLGTSNSDHFLIASQDRSLQRKVMAVPGGAVVFASVNGVHLETPSDLQKQKVKQAEEAHMRVRPAEKKSAALGAVEEEDAAAAEAKQRAAAFKRKKAKGPNPLSMQPKKKKKPAQQAQQQQGQQQQQQQAAAAAAGGGGQEGGRVTESSKKKRPRRRKRGEGAGPGAAGGDSD